MSTVSRRAALRALAAAPAILVSRKSSAQDLPEIAKGPFDGTAESLRQYRIPDWFRDAKFGMWAHWGPQSGAEDGDWYARNIYIQGSEQYKYHVEHYGHPSKFGHKDICRLWKGDQFDPDHLMSLYKKAGAKYFMSMGVHHDNFDLWNSQAPAALERGGHRAEEGRRGPVARRPARESRTEVRRQRAPFQQL